MKKSFHILLLSGKLCYNSCMEILRCPICKKTLKKEAKSYVCEARHCFDIAKSGYVNLLPPNKKKTPLPGDNAEMIAARSALMDCGYYDSLIAAILKLLSSKPSGNLLDIGCGEGIITQKIKERYPEINILGVDISKFAANAAAKRCPDNLYVVASITSLPAADGSIDTILNAFAPIDLPEANRVLSESGSIIKVVPGPNHLWGLKRLLYETPYKNPEESFFSRRLYSKRKNYGNRCLLRQRQNDRKPFADDALFLQNLQRKHCPHHSPGRGKNRTGIFRNALFKSTIIIYYRLKKIS